MTRGKILLVALFLVLVTGFFALDLGQYMSLGYLKSRQAEFAALFNERPLIVGGIFFLIYVTVTAVSLPGALLMTIAAGALFGLWWGVLIVSFASTIGATLAMLAARFVFREQVRQRFRKQLDRVDRGIEREGAFYLFTMRLVPAFPFFAINLVMGLTNISIPLFFIVSQIGMLAGTIVYVNAGTQLGQIESLGGILSPELIISFTLLGLFPLIAKKVVDVTRARKILKGFDKPKTFDRDVVVIGAGSGGLVAALIAATVKAKVTLIEKDRMGGDCLNTGCVPSKSLIRSAKLAADMRRGQALGFRKMQPDFDFADIMERVQGVIEQIKPHDSVERYESLGVNVEMGEAKVLSPWRVAVNGKELTTRNIILATGATPFVPPIDGIEEAGYHTSDTIWSLRKLPPRLVVLGGGPIGTELTQTFNRLGSEVTQIEAASQILVREDREVAEIVMDAMQEEGVNVLTGHKATKVIEKDGEKFLIAEGRDGKEAQVAFDELLVAVGREASVRGYGLEALGVRLTDRGTVEVNDYLQTNYPNIYAIGDVAGPYQFTHTASHMAWFATVNALFGTFWKFRVDYSVIPWCTFTSPEVARVGLNEQEAREQGVDFEITTYDVGKLDRAVADEEKKGLVKVLTVPGKDRILGVTIVADHAGDLLAEYVLAMKHGIGLNKILSTIHIYPTLAEMNKYAASEWRKAHKPETLLGYVESYHAWRRGRA